MKVHIATVNENNYPVKVTKFVKETFKKFKKDFILGTADDYDLLIALSPVV